MSLRILAGVVAYVGFCVLVAGVQFRALGAPFWLSALVDAAVVAAFVGIVACLIYVMG